MIFYTADLHLGHDNVIDYSNRPFKNSDEMLECIISNWNAAVSHNDEVYIIGDLFFKMNSEGQLNVIRGLNGKKHLIVGNHDRKFNEAVTKEFSSINNYLRVIDEGRRVILSHYPMLEWESFFRNAYHIYGHIHNNFDTSTYQIIKNNPEHFKNAFNAGVDVNGFTPRTLNELIEINAE